MSGRFGFYREGKKVWFKNRKAKKSLDILDTIVKKILSQPFVASQIDRTQNLPGKGFFLIVTTVSQSGITILRTVPRKSLPDTGWAIKVLMMKSFTVCTAQSTFIRC